MDNTLDRLLRDHNGLRGITRRTMHTQRTRPRLMHNSEREHLANVRGPLKRKLGALTQRWHLNSEMSLWRICALKRNLSEVAISVEEKQLRRTLPIYTRTQDEGLRHQNVCHREHQTPEHLRQRRPTMFPLPRRRIVDQSSKRCGCCLRPRFRDASRNCHVPRERRGQGAAGGPKMLLALCLPCPCCSHQNLPCREWQAWNFVQQQTQKTAWRMAAWKSVSLGQ